MVNIQKNNQSNQGHQRLIEGSGESITAFLVSELKQHAFSGTVAVAVSGGIDSMSLLHALCTLASESDFKLHVCHVNHGLQAIAGDWVTFIHGFCITKQIPFSHVRLDPATRQNAQSIEDWARQGRYAALANMAQSHQASCIVLAQHEDDQIETHLLQKARGAGARGQAAMPAVFHRFGMHWRRPWLAVSQAHIDVYASHHAVPYVTDPSNANPRFARNDLRMKHQKAPLNQEERLRILTDVRTAQANLAHEHDWAEQVLMQYHIQPRQEIGEVSCLRGLKLTHYSGEQQALLIRHWFASVGMRMPTRAALKELIKQLNNPRIDQHMCWQHADGAVVTRFREVFIIGRQYPEKHLEQLQLLAADVEQYGIDAERLRQLGLTLRERQGGERIRLHPKRPVIGLKLAYQNADIAPMLRMNLPLVYCGDALVYAAGLGMNIDDCVVGGQALAWSVIGDLI